MLQNGSGKTLAGAVQGRLSKWGARFQGLDDKIEILEVVFSVLTFYMGYWFGSVADDRTSSRAAHALLSLAPQWAWEWGLKALAVAALVAYLEDWTRLRRLASFLTFAFWYLSGVWLCQRLPDVYTPGLHVVLGFIACFMWTRIAEFKIQQTYRAGAEPRRLWWLTGRR